MPSTSVSSIRPSWPLRTRLLSIKTTSVAVDRAENIGSRSAQAGRQVDQHEHRLGEADDLRLVPPDGDVLPPDANGGSAWLVEGPYALAKLGEESWRPTDLPPKPTFAAGRHGCGGLSTNEYLNCAFTITSCKLITLNGGRSGRSNSRTSLRSRLARCRRL